MKWAVLVAYIVLCIGLAFHLRQNRRSMRWMAFAFGFLPFVLSDWHLYIAPYVWPMWPGHTKGIEVSVLDFLAIAVAVSPGKAKGAVGAVWPWLAYWVFVALSLPHAGQSIPALFYLWQLARMILVFIAAFRIGTHPQAGKYLLYGVFAGGVCQLIYVAIQYTQGVLQPGGTMGTQNLLGLVTHFALIPALGLLLVGRSNALVLAAFVAAVLVDIATASRATLAVAAVGCVLMIVLSSMKRMTGRKVGILFAAALVGTALVPFALSTLDKRKAINSTEQSNAERDSLARAAWLIIGDYPLGTGPNQYVLLSNTGGYAQRAGVQPTFGSRAASVHNSYLLVLAETGPLGLLGMLLAVFVPLVRALWGALRYKADKRSDLALAMAAAMLAVAMHLLFEWVFLLFAVQYLLAMFGGMCAGLVFQMKADAKAARKSRAASVPDEPEAWPLGSEPA